VARRKPSRLTTGRLQSLRLFSTLLAITLIDRIVSEIGLVSTVIGCNGLYLRELIGTRQTMAGAELRELTVPTVRNIQKLASSGSELPRPRGEI
jgi:hypothetical protein